MEVGDHFRITGTALRHWAIAQSQDSAAVAALWLVGLLILRVPWAPFWALLAAVLQFVPHLGAVLGMIGPVLAATIKFGDWEHPLYVLILYAIIVVIDGLLLQPYFMRRTAKIPILASIFAPIVLGLIWTGWGALLAAPLLAIVYAYKARHKQAAERAEPHIPPASAASEHRPELRDRSGTL
jgi:predicted PurR-regulated permease PerM